MLPPSRTERMIRGLLLLTISALLSLIGWLLGLYNLPNQNWTYLGVLGIIAAAAILSRFGAKWLVRRQERLRNLK